MRLSFYLIDPFKIEFLRYDTHPYLVWLSFALWPAAHRVRSDQLRAAGIKP